MNERITTCGIVIKDHKVLMGMRGPGHGNEGFWEFPGGKNRYGESAEDTLRREFEEELSVGIEVGDRVGGYDFTNKDTLYHLQAYRVVLLGEDFSLSVHTSLRWITREELSALPMLESDKAIAALVLPLL